MYCYTRISEEDSEIASLLEKNLSRRNETFDFKLHEFLTEKELCDKILDTSDDLSILDLIYHSFKVPQIGKEMDLLRISDSMIINIELKSNIEPVENDEKIKQLKQNKYYLQFLNRELFLLSYTQGDDKLKILFDDKLRDYSFNELKELLLKQNKENIYEENIDNLFDPANYLISPFNSTEAFLQNEYYLTAGQENIENDLLKMIESDTKIFTVEGSAGTGKTLLLYDLAKKVAQIDATCIIHSGILNDGHSKINESVKNLNIISAKEARTNTELLAKYKYIFIDEAHRIYKNTLENIVSYCQNSVNVKLYLFYDYKQCMSISEINRNIPAYLNSLENVKKRKLKDKIRTNEELASLIKLVMKSTDFSGKVKTFPSAKILYANNSDEAKRIIRFMQKKEGFYFINYTSANYGRTIYDEYESLAYSNTHKIIGQEFDNVLVVIGSNFSYNENNQITSTAHPTGDYNYRSMLFQALTRVRKKLCIIVVNNKSVYERLIFLEKNHTSTSP